MSVIKRIQDLVRGNINDMLDRMEDPETALRQLMRDLQEEKQKANTYFSRCLIDEKRLEVRIGEHQKLEQQWHQRARLAVVRDDDSLAREAIEQRQREAARIAELTSEWEEQHHFMEELRAAIRLLDRRFDEAQDYRERLLARYRRAEAQRLAQQSLSRVGVVRSDRPFQMMEEKILNSTAAALAARDMASLTSEEKFRLLETQSSADRELLQLKMEAGKTVPGLYAAPDHQATAEHQPALPE